MMIFRKVAELRQYLKISCENVASIGFVPTMGALHPGHLDLIKTAKKETELVVCSIFVNPTQFNDPKDYALYPITTDTDVYLLEKENCDVLFLPSVEEIYPNGPELDTKYDLGYIETVLEGAARPGHYQGVCQVVHRLLSIVQPHQLFMGQKDYQQCLVVNRLISLYNIQVKLTVCPTIRETSGLAMSSRNKRLSEAEQKTALNLYTTLTRLKARLQPGEVTPTLTKETENLEEKGLKVDYLAAVKKEDFTVVKSWNGIEPLIILVAAYVGEVRLIDNIILA